MGRNPVMDERPVSREKRDSDRTLPADRLGTHETVNDRDVADSQFTVSTRVPDPAEATPSPLPRIPGFESLRVLGQGGMGIVFQARQVSLGRIVAVKMTLGGAFASPKTKARFLREAHSIAQLRHPNIVEIYDYGEAHEQAYYAMEFVDGIDLAQWICEPRTCREIAAMMEPIARGVDFAHSRGVIHRDLKPANVLIARNGVPKIADFGLSKTVDDPLSQDGEAGSPSRLTVTGEILGTPSYMAPEQASGVVRGIGPATDVYALGAILYRLLTGRPPFEGVSIVDTISQVVASDPTPVRKLNPGVPRDLETIVAKALEKRPDRRYATAGEFADDLRRWSNDESITARRPTVRERMSRSVRRNRKRLLWGVVLLSVVAAVWYWAVFVRVDPQVRLRREEIARVYERYTQSTPPVHRTPHPSRKFVAALPDEGEAEFEQVSRMLIWDMRFWKPVPADRRGEPISPVVLVRRQRMRKLAAVDIFRFNVRTSGYDVFTRSSTHRDKMTVLAADDKFRVGGTPMKSRQVVIDVSDVEGNQEFNVETTSTYWNAFQDASGRWLGAIVKRPTLKISIMLVFPEDRPMKTYQLRVAQSGGNELRAYDGEQIVIVDPDRRYLLWECVRPKPGHVYRIDWTW